MAIQADLDKGGPKFPVPSFSMGPSLGAFSRAVPVIDVTLPPYGADPTGSRDSTPAILAAIAGLPSGGGGLYFPGIFNISSPLVLTQSGTFILGTGDIGSALCQINWTGSTLSGPMIDFVGAAKGGGLHGIGLNGNSLASTALRLTAWSNGRFDDFYTIGFTGTNVILRSLATTPTGNANTQYTRFTNYSLFLPNVANAAGILCDGNGVNNATNTSFCSFNDGQILFNNGIGSSLAFRGVTLRDCDSIEFDNLGMFGGGSGTLPFVFDYSGVGGGQWPASCYFKGYDPDGNFLSSVSGVSNISVPSASARPNNFDFLFETNAGIYPKIANASYKPYIVGPGIALTGQTASIGTTNVNPVPIYVKGMYRFSYALLVTTIGSGGTITLQITWVDDAGTHTNVNLGGTINLNALSNNSAAFPLTLNTSTNISFSTTVVGATGNPQYALYIKLEKMD